MATVPLETPSRIWRRIEEVEGRDMPSLPSLPGFENSVDSLDSSSDAPMGQRQLSQRVADLDDEDSDLDLSKASAPLHSTPTITSNLSSTKRSSTSSARKFADSLARSSFAGRSTTRSFGGANSLSRAMTASNKDKSFGDSFDVSAIPSLPGGHHSILQDPHLSSDEDDHVVGKDSLSDALESVSRTSSPYPAGPSKSNPKTPENFGYSFYDYKAKLNMSSAKVCSDFIFTHPALTFHAAFSIG